MRLIRVIVFNQRPVGSGGNWYALHRVHLLGVITGQDSRLEFWDDDLKELGHYREAPTDNTTGFFSIYAETHENYVVSYVVGLRNAESEYESCYRCAARAAFLYVRSATSYIYVCMYENTQDPSRETKLTRGPTQKPLKSRTFFF